MAVLSCARDARFEQLYTDHVTALVVFVTKLTRQRQTAEDIVQETMLRAWKNAETMPVEPSEVRRWLYTVARHLTVDMLRSKRARPQEVSASADWFNTIENDDCAEAAILSPMMSQVIRGLSDNHVTVLRELYLLGYKADDVAARHGVPVGTVRSRAHYAVHSLRAGLTAVD